MLKYIPGLVGAVAAMLAYRVLTVLDFSVRVLIFFIVYLVVTVIVDKSMSRYGKKNS